MSERLTSAPSGSLLPPPAAAAPLPAGLAVELLHAASSSMVPRIRAADLRRSIPCLSSRVGRAERASMWAPTDVRSHPSPGRDLLVARRGSLLPVARPGHLL